MTNIYFSTISILSILKLYYKIMLSNFECQEYTMGFPMLILLNLQSIYFFGKSIRW